MNPTKIIVSIQKKIDDRMVFIKKYDKSYNSKTNKHKIEEPKEIDSIGKEIRTLINSNVNILPIDFMIETLTKLGDAPSIVYDDNGMFQVTGTGFQKMVFGNERLEGGFTVIVEKKMWKKTIREALKIYLKS